MTTIIPCRILKVAVVGGGPGGLASTIALDKVPNLEVTLFEQAKVLREAGAGINIGQNTWNVLELLGVADSLKGGHPSLDVLNYNGGNGEELTRTEMKDRGKHTRVRIQRTSLQASLLKHVKPALIRYGKRLEKTEDLGEDGVKLFFMDGTVDTFDLVVGSDGIRSVVRDGAWPEYPLEFTGTTIWRALLPRAELEALDPRFNRTAWWHLPTSHVYFSPVSDDLSEIAAREYQDPKLHAANKFSWGVPVTNEHVESHFNDYLPQVQAAIKAIPEGDWREFAAFAGPELSRLTAWDNKIALVGDASHALSGAFGSGAGFAMEDGWVLAQALTYFENDLGKALPLFDNIRLPYYARMYALLEQTKQKREEGLKEIGTPTDEDKVKAKVIRSTGDMSWMYENDVGRVWESAVANLKAKTVNDELASSSSSGDESLT